MSGVNDPRAVAMTSEALQSALGTMADYLGPPIDGVLHEAMRRLTIYEATLASIGYEPIPPKAGG